MRRATGCGRCVWVGLVLSAILHAAIAAALLRPRTPPSPEPIDRDQVVALDLAMFGNGSGNGESATSAAVADTHALAMPTEPPAPAPETATHPATAADDETIPPRAAASSPAPPPVVRAPTQPRAVSMPPTRSAKDTRKVSRDTPKPRPIRNQTKPAPKATPRMERATKRQPAMRFAEPPDPRPTSTQVSNPSGQGHGAVASGAIPGAGPSGADPNRARGRSDAGAPSTVRASSERAYLDALQRAIAKHQQYPMSARRDGDTGIVLVAFVIQADGRITGGRVAQSSGHRELDQAALQAVTQLGRFMPIPPSLARQSWPLRVPIRFALK